MFKTHFINGGSIEKILYRKCVNKLTKIKTSSKKMYCQSELEVNKSNSLKTWELLKTILPRHKNSQFPTSLLIEDNIDEDLTNITNEFNTFFSTIGEKLASNCNDYNPSNFTTFLKKSVFPSLSLITPSFNDIKNTIHNNKAVGRDNIPAMFLKVASDVITPFLFVFLDLMFTKGIFQDNCKVAKIIPVYKSGSKLDINNYRPVSILSSFTKIFEKHICIRLMYFCNKHETFYPTQYGFQKNKSTTHAALDLVTEMYDNINSNQYTGLVLLDFKKAFDAVSHSVLLHKLQHYGVRGPSLDLLQSYLDQRKQFVSIVNTSSQIASISFGVPQGSTLGPLLFLIYINDLPNAGNCIPRLFAHDTCLISRNFNLSKLEFDMNEDLVKIHKWRLANKVIINPVKSSALIIPPKITKSNISAETAFTIKKAKLFPIHSLNIWNC